MAVKEGDDSVVELVFLLEASLGFSVRREFELKRLLNDIMLFLFVN